MIPSFFSWKLHRSITAYTWFNRFFLNKHLSRLIREEQPFPLEFILPVPPLKVRIISSRPFPVVAYSHEMILPNFDHFLRRIWKGLNRGTNESGVI